MRGRHGKGGRKATGRKRTKVLNGAKFTGEERAGIVKRAKESGMTQSDFLINATAFYSATLERRNDERYNLG